MARALLTINNAGTTVAQFRAYGQALSNNFKQVLTQAGDSGQVNWATVALPAQGALGNYEIYTFGDTLQATAPIFIRVDYIFSAGTTFQPIFRFGTGTDGAGTLLNSPFGVVVGLSSQLTLNPNAYSFSGQMLWSNGDGSQLVFLQGLNTSSSGLDSYFSAFVIERFRNADGSPNGDGVNAWAWANNTVGGTSYPFGLSRIFASPTGWINESTPPCFVPWGTTGPVTAFSGSTATAFPFFTWGERQLRGPSQAILLGYQGDWPRNSETSVMHSGASKKFWSMGPATRVFLPTINFAGSSGALTLGPLFRYE